jgi:dihydroorotate dehydrogenase
MFKIIKPLLFLFSPETSHNIVVFLLRFVACLPGSHYLLRFFYGYKSPDLEKEVMGIKFRNPVGLAAGFDKNGEVFNQLDSLGFGFIEIGSLTPVNQPGNPKPRCFRLKKEKAIINRMGINNKGIKYALGRLKNKRGAVTVGANIIKGTHTSNDKAALDYEKSFAQLYDFVDYFVINVSCPNVKDVTKLQDITSLSAIIDRITTLRKYYDEYRPVLLKVSPDLTYDQLDEIIELILVSGIDGIIANNTTISRANLNTDDNVLNNIGEGGLSGAPLYATTLERVKYIYKKTNGMLPIIASGGIMSPYQAKELLDSGAALVQIYTGFIFNGPGFVKKILKHLQK